MKDRKSNSPGAHVESDENMGNLDTRIAVLEQQVDDITTMFLSSTKFETMSLFSTADRVTKAQELYDAQGIYPRGCSEFVCAVLGIPYELAKTLMGTDPDEITDWSTITAGAIVGWQKPNGPFDHVSAYVNDGSSKFIDVRQPAPDSKPRRLGSYGTQKVYLSSRFGS
jgi:hypothetical protein